MIRTHNLNIILATGREIQENTFSPYKLERAHYLDEKTSVKRQQRLWKLLNDAFAHILLHDCQPLSMTSEY